MKTETRALLHSVIDRLDAHPGICDKITVTIQPHHATIEGAPTGDGPTADLFAPLIARTNGRDTLELTPADFVVTVTDGSVEAVLYPRFVHEDIFPIDWLTAGVDDADLDALVEWIANYRYRASSADGLPVKDRDVYLARQGGVGTGTDPVADMTGGKTPAQR